MNKVCGSGLKAVMLAAQAIRAGDAELIVAGGMESMTNAPYLLPEARGGVRLGHGKLIDSMVWDGLWDIYNDFHMGMTGELVAKKYEITRRQQDEFAASSHQKAAEATKAGRFDAEKFKVMIPQRKGEPLAYFEDENVRGDTTADSIAKLKPAFDPQGTVTAANASSINDGAAAVVVMSADKAKQLGVKPLARITGYAAGGCAPEWVMMAPEKSIQACALKLKKKPNEFDLHEINEAFSVAAIALMRVLDSIRRKSTSPAARSRWDIRSARQARKKLDAAQRDESSAKPRRHASLCLGGGNAVSSKVSITCVFDSTSSVRAR